jgi:serine/threonine protein kinase
MPEKYEYSDFEWGRTLGEGSYGVVVLARIKDNVFGNKFNSQDTSKLPREFAIKKLSKQFIERENLIQKRSGGRDVLGQVRLMSLYFYSKFYSIR